MPLNLTGPNAKVNIGTFNNVAGNQSISSYARFYEIYGDVVMNQITNTIDTKELKTIQLVVNIPRAQATRKDYQTSKKSGPCFEGTRVALLGEMMDWATSSGESKMYALSGLAGIGKSTVAYTVAAQADDRGLLGASFFFSRDEVDRRTARKFFTTLAHQLCMYKEEFAQAIGEVLVTERGSLATTATPQEQLDTLILEPLRAISASRDQLILVVVDALDECDDDDAPLVLTGLRRMAQDLPSFKVILTTRPQPLVSHDFATLRGHKIFHLQDIEDKVVNDDIRLYLKHSLSREQVKARLQDPTEQWHASDVEIELLVQAAGKLFIIASTAVRFILDKYWSDPANRTKILLDAFAQNRTPFDDLSHFYTTILRSAIPANCCDNGLVERYQVVVGIIVLIQVPVPVGILASLSGVDSKQISVVLRQLQSVIQVGADNIPIIYHKSFSDYITDQARCKDANLRIELTIRHTWIVVQCFEIMNSHLKYNILRLEGSARFMDNEKGLTHQGVSDEELLERISGGLRYACAYWANHLESANIADAGLIEELTSFVNTHMLHWFEALSLIGKLDSAHRSIRVALKLMKRTSSDLFQLLSDGLRFISKFYEVIKRSALHTYYSALPFTPTESLLYRRYNKEAADSIFRVVVGPENWNALLATQRHGNRDRPSYVKFSLDSAMFASWDHESVRFWDAATGTPMSTISHNSSHAATSGDGDIYVSIANDFSIVASAGDDTITLYSVKTSTPVASFTTSRVWGLALSSESNRVAALLSGGSLCLWDTGTSERIANIAGFDLVPHILKFSPTGARLAYMPCTGGIIQLRDGITGELIANLDDSSRKCQELVFSHDGSRFAVLTEKALRLWKSEGGELVGVATVYAWGYPKLAITANGSLLATAVLGKVQLWSGNSGHLLTLIDELDHGPSIYSLAFSPDDILTYTTLSNITLYDVRSRSVISTLPINSDPSMRTFSSFSPDGNRLAAMTYDGIVRLWDVQNTRMLSSSSTKEAKYIRNLALSQGCARLACLFEDDAIELWDIGATKRRIPIHGGQYDLYDRRAPSIGFSPDGTKFAAVFSDGTIRLWDSDDGALIKSIKYFAPVGLEGPRVALSNRMLAAGGRDVLALWDLRKLHPSGTIKHYYPTHLTFSNNGDLLAFASDDLGRHKDPGVRYTVTVLDVLKRTVIATFEVEVPGDIDNMTFMSDDSQLVLQFTNGDFQSFHLVSKEIKHGPTFNHLIHHRYFPLWRAAPVPKRWECYCLVGLFPQHEDPVPVLWIPKELRIVECAQESSMIACSDGQAIFVLSPSSLAESNPDSFHVQDILDVRNNESRSNTKQVYAQFGDSVTSRKRKRE